MNILVTGAFGYIGPLVLRELKRLGHYLTVLDAGYFLPNYAEAPVYPDEAVFLDLRDMRVQLQPKYDAIVHMAGLSNDPMGDIHPNLTIRINYKATIDLIRSQPQARHVFVSSCAVYGASGGVSTEASEVKPLTAYAQSKAMVDAWLSEHREFNGISLRLGTVYGYSPGHRIDLVVNRMVYDAVGGLPITVNGKPFRPLTHVEDVATAIAWAVGVEHTGIVNVVGENYQINKLAEAIGDFCGAPLIYSKATDDARDYMADGGLLRAMGWSSQHTVEGSLPVLSEKTITLPPGLKRYVRLAALKKLIDSGSLTTTLQRPEVAAAA